GVKVTAPVVVANTLTQQPVAGQSVSYVFASTGFTKTIVVNTDTNGNATVPTAGLPAGTYSVTASFLPAALAGKDTYYSGATLPLASFTMNAQTVAFTTLPTTPTTYSPPGTFQVAAALSGPNAGLPVAITSSTPDVCTVAGAPALPQANYTATIVRGGACVLAADLDGNDFYTAAHLVVTITIVKAVQAITITGLSSNCSSPVKTYGDVPFTVGVTGGGSGLPVTFTSSATC